MILESSSDRSSATSVAGPAATTAKAVHQLFLPHTILSPLPIVAHEPGEGRVGRRFPWGFADPYNPEHCDFVRLKDSVFSEWRSELREASRVVWYERWRTNRLNRNGQPASRQSQPTKSYGGRTGPGNPYDGRRTR